VDAIFQIPALAVLSDWTGLIAAVAAVVGIVFVAYQLRAATAASRAEATIQFQRAFWESGPARARIQKSFPIHEDALRRLSSSPLAEFRTWRTLDELTAGERRDAEVVINAMNDVAQYVADGLSLRSALQQYHTVFVRLGFLVLPYVDARNAPINGRPQARIGRRLVDLYNASIAYHRRHPKHRGRELALRHDSEDGSTSLRLILLDERGLGVSEHRGFPDESWPQPETVQRRLALRRAIRKAERRLRS
jgi:hypothetical protein